MFFLLLAVSFVAFIFFIRPKPIKFATAMLEGKFSISIPEYLIKKDSICNDAVLQYDNEQENIFLAVYEHHDSASIQDIFKRSAGGYVSTIEHGTLQKYYPEKINGHDAFIGNIRGSVKETKVYYRMAVIQCAHGALEIVIGTGNDNESRFTEDMDTIIHSIQPE